MKTKTILLVVAGIIALFLIYQIVKRYFLSSPKPMNTGTGTPTSTGSGTINTSTGHQPPSAEKIAKQNVLEYMRTGGVSKTPLSNVQSKTLDNIHNGQVGFPPSCITWADMVSGGASSSALSTQWKKCSHDLG